MAKKNNTRKSSFPYIKQIRLAFHVSIQTFANLIKVKKSTLGDWEKEGTEPTLTISSYRRLDKLLNEIEMSLDDIPSDIFGVVEFKREVPQELIRDIKQGNY